jgi:hypothetical protein
MSLARSAFWGAKLTRFAHLERFGPKADNAPMGVHCGKEHGMTDPEKKRRSMAGREARLRDRTSADSAPFVGIVCNCSYGLFVVLC